MGYIYTKEYYSGIKINKATDTHESTNGSENISWAKEFKQKEYILYDSIYRKFSHRQ